MLKPQIPGPQPMVKAVHIREHEKEGRHYHASRPARSLADVIRSLAPDYPRRGPFRAGDPHPAVSRVENPRTIMIARPRPRLITDPVPSDVRPFPVAGSIRPPPRRHTRRTPAAPMTAHIHPRAIRR